MNNRMRLSAQTAPARDHESTDVPPTAQTNTAEPTSTEDEVKKWSEKGRELSTQFYDSRAEADQKIIAGFREIQEKSKAVKKAFRDALNIENWEATRFRKVAEANFLDQTETVEVFGKLTISQQYELAKASDDVKLAIREHIRTHPNDMSWRKLRKLRVAEENKQKAEAGNATKPKPEAGSATKQTPEAGSATKQTPEAGSTSKLESALGEIRSTAGVSFDTMEGSVRDEFLSWLDAAPKSVEVIRFFEQG